MYSCFHYVLHTCVDRYDFTKLLPRMVAFVEVNIDDLTCVPGNCHGYVIRWLLLAERLQMVRCTHTHAMRKPNLMACCSLAPTHSPQPTNHSPQPSTHNPQPTTLNPQPTTHNPQRTSCASCASAR
jgi:hypothetical protein